MESKKGKTSKQKVMYIVSAMIPLIIILAAGLIPKDPITWIFAAVTAGLYTLAIVLASKILKIREEYTELINKTNSKCNDTMTDEEKFEVLNYIVEEGKLDKYQILYDSYYTFRKSLRKINEEDASGQIKRKFYATTDAQNFFDEDSVVYKNIYYKTINYITQGLTGVGIFGTFLGIVRGISGLDMSNTEVMKSGIAQLLEGVSVSFNTSLYGILFSVTLTFILKVSIEKTMKVSNKFSNELNKIVPMNNEKEGLKEIEDELKKQTLSLEKLATDLAEEMGKKFDISMQENLAKLTQDLGAFVTKMEANFSNSITESTTATALTLNSTIGPSMQKLESVISNMQTQQEQSSVKFMEESMQAMKEAINIGASNEMDKLKESMEIISSKNAEMVDTFTSSMENMKMLTLHQENLIKNTTDSTQSMNITTENIKDLQSSLSTVIEGLRDVSSNSNVSLSNIQNTIESMKDSMIKQVEINQSVQEMVEKSHELSKTQDRYINRLDKMTNVIDKNMENTQKHISSITSEINTYKTQFESIQKSTVEVVSALDSRYKSLVNDLTLVNTNLSSTVDSVDKNIVLKVNDMSNKLQSLMKDLSDYQAKTANLTSKIERFAQVEESTQELWTNYKSTFENLNETITDGVENYNKHINNGVAEVLTQFDSSIASAVHNLKQVADALGDTAEEISDNLEVLTSKVPTR